MEVSQDNGTSWVPVYVHERSEAGTGAVSYAIEPLFARSINLSNFGGKTIRLRFRYSVGAAAPPGSTPLGWYVDDIAIVNEHWVDVAGTAGSSSSLAKGSGSYCYRVRTNFILSGTTVPTPFSNVVNVTVVPGVAAAVSRKAHTGGSYDIPLH